jgi:hypothetical protein
MQRYCPLQQTGMLTALQVPLICRQSMALTSSPASLRAGQSPTRLHTGQLCYPLFHRVDTRSAVGRLTTTILLNLYLGLLENRAIAVLPGLRSWWASRNQAGYCTAVIKQQSRRPENSYAVDPAKNIFRRRYTKQLLST